MISFYSIPFLFTLALGIVGAQRYLLPPFYNYRPNRPLTPDQQRWVIDKEQRNELPILNPRNLDPNLLMVCDDSLTADDIYTGLLAVMVRVEDTLRRNRCNPNRFAIHRFPINVHTLLGKLQSQINPHLQQHPILGTFLDTMQARAAELIKKASYCQLDYVLLMKIVRMSMKLLVNKVMCGFVEVDVLRNRYGWPRKYGTRTGSRYPPYWDDSMSSPPLASYYDGPLYPYTRDFPYYYPPSKKFDSPSPSPLAPKVIPATIDRNNDVVKPIQKWPYYPPYYAPSNPYLGALGPDGKQLNGVESGCKNCDKNRDVINP